jgi:hypothetical protein
MSAEAIPLVEAGTTIAPSFEKLRSDLKDLDDRSLLTAYINKGVHSKEILVMGYFIDRVKHYHAKLEPLVDKMDTCYKNNRMQYEKNGRLDDVQDFRDDISGWAHSFASLVRTMVEEFTECPHSVAKLGQHFSEEIETLNFFEIVSSSDRELKKLISFGHQAMLVSYNADGDRELLPLTNENFPKSVKEGAKEVRDCCRAVMCRIPVFTMLVMERSAILHSKVDAVDGLQQRMTGGFMAVAFAVSPILTKMLFRAVALTDEQDDS